MHEKWENIKTIINETKQQLREKDESTETLKNRRYDEEGTIAIDEMKKARGKQLIEERRETEEHEYHHKRREHKIFTNKKKLYIKNVIESIEEDQKHNNTRKMYQTINQFNINLT